MATILVATAGGFTQPAYAANVSLNLQAALSQLQLPAGNYTSPTVLASVGLTFVPTVKVGNGPIGVAVTPDGNHAYVANSSDNTVSVIDTATNNVLTGTGFPIPVGNVPVGVGIMP